MVLVDTSVWIDHLRRTDSDLVKLLESDQVTTHPFVVGELACGNLKNRDEIISRLWALPTTTRVTDDELLVFIDQHALAGRGLGLIDMHLLASCILDGYVLWTKDKQLAAAAGELACSLK